MSDTCELRTPLLRSYAPSRRFTLGIGHLRGKFVLRELSELGRPPADLFQPLFNLQLPSCGRCAINFSHKYDGPYEMGLLVAGRLPMPIEMAAWNVHINVELKAREQLLRRTIGEEMAPWWSTSNCGFTLLRYRVPDDLPANEEIDAAILVEMLKLPSEHSPVSLFVRRASNK